MTAAPTQGTANNATEEVAMEFSQVVKRRRMSAKSADGRTASLNKVENAAAKPGSNYKFSQGISASNPSID